MNRSIPLLIAATLLAGCSTAPDGLIGELSPRGLFQTTPVPRPIGPAEALARLPGEAGRMVSVNEARAESEVWQRIVLVGDAMTRGENGIDIHLARGAERVPRPTDRDVYREIQERFPGIAMAPSTTLLRTRQGPLGMAYGRSGRQGCLYAWQYLDGTEDGVRSILTVTDRPVVASVRVRLCRDGLDQAGAQMIASNLVVGAGAGATAGLGQMDALAFVDPLRGILAPAAGVGEVQTDPLIETPRPRRTASRPQAPRPAAPAPVAAAPALPAPTVAPTIAAPPIPLPTGITPARVPTIDAGVVPPAPTTPTAAVPLPKIPSMAPAILSPTPPIPLPTKVEPPVIPPVVKPGQVPATTASVRKIIPTP